jgi:hypothetical protein
MQNSSYLIVEVFEITGRGAVVVLDDVIELNVGKPINIRITRPDGVAFDAVAFIELLLRRVPMVIEKTALRLPDIPKSAVSVGSVLALN